MAEVRLSGLYKVTVTEYDCGVQRVDPDDTKFFTTLEEAEAYKYRQDCGSPECYWRCTIEKVA
jgi:hypothetical protein